MRRYTLASQGRRPPVPEPRPLGEWGYPGQVPISGEGRGYLGALVTAGACAGPLLRVHGAFESRVLHARRMVRRAVHHATSGDPQRALRCGSVAREGRRWERMRMRE